MPTQTADAVVIGAGINGAATALNLMKRGMRSVVLIDRHLIASGGTGRSAAIIRQHYSNEELVRMVKRSVEVFSHFDDVVGGDCGFVNTGWAFFVPASVSEGFERNVAMGQRLGVDVREIGPDDLHAIEPRVQIDDVARIAYEPGSGYADPVETTHAYVRRFVALGGRLQALTAVTGLTRSGSRVTGVQTDQGEIATGVVVNAAGPWAARIAAWAGVELPIEVTREEEIIVQTTDAGGPPKLCFSDMAQAFYYRPHGTRQMLVGRGYPKQYETVDPDDFRAPVDVPFIRELRGRLHRRWPCFRDAVAVNAYTGLYDVTPDWHPVLGPVRGLDGFYLCAGFSGHGFKIGPAVGELMAELIVGGTSTVPLDRFSLERFAEGKLLTAAYGGNRA